MTASSGWATEIIYLVWKFRGLLNTSGEGDGIPLQYSCLGKSHGRKSLVGYSPWGREESDTTERRHFHFSLSCIGEGNGNPLQCSCLENPRDGGAWWAVVYGVAQSRTRLKRLSSSNWTCQVYCTTKVLGFHERGTESFRNKGTCGG